MRVLKTLMYSLVQTKNGDGLSPAEQLRNARQLAFVTTDLQSSTSQASASPHGFLKVQEIHDTVSPASSPPHPLPTPTPHAAPQRTKS